MMQKKSLMGCNPQLLRMQRIVLLASKKQKTSSEKSDTKGKAASKKQTEKPSKASVKYQGKGKGSKKSKKEPSRKDMQAVVVDILKEIDKILENLLGVATSQ
ncbi:hypothetical protein S245_071461 [Arachis hypogaea]|nr:uncharacterized protein DS421_20g704870 [Arachis hypogaea]